MIVNNKEELKNTEIDFCGFKGNLENYIRIDGKRIARNYFILQVLNRSFNTTEEQYNTLTDSLKKITIGFGYRNGKTLYDLFDVLSKHVKEQDEFMSDLEWVLCNPETYKTGKMETYNSKY